MPEVAGRLENQGLEKNSAAETLLDLTPGELRGLARPLARLVGVMAGCRTLERAAHDALADTGDTKKVVRHAELPYPAFDGAAPGSVAVGRDVLLFRWDPESGQIDVLEPRNLPRADPPQHHMVGEVRERMPEGRELPVDHREHAR